MALVTCWSVKAGSGTTVVAAALALAARSPVVALDLDGDLVATLGLDDQRGQGLGDWLRSDAEPAALAGLGVTVTPKAAVVPVGGIGVEHTSRRWIELTAFMAIDARLWVIDGGCAPPPATVEPGEQRRRVLVQRACYVALRRARLKQPDADAVVLVHESGRALGATDVGAVLGLPVTATFAVDPKIARAIDAGTLATSLPHAAAAELRPLTRFDSPVAASAAGDELWGLGGVIRSRTTGRPARSPATRDAWPS